MQTIQRVISRFEDLSSLRLRYAIKNFIYVGGEQVASTFFGILSIYAIANFLTPEVAGEYKYITSIAFIMSAFTLTGVMYGVTREVALGNHNIINYAYKQSLKYAIFPVLLSLVVGGYYFYKFNFEYSFAIILATLFTTLSSVFLLYKSYLAGKEDFKLASRLTILGNLFVAISTFIGFYFSNNLSLIIITSVGTQALINFIIFKNINKIKKLKNTLSEEVIIRYNKYVISQSKLNIFTLGAQNIDKVLMFQFLGPKELAIYSITTVVVDRMRGILKAVGTIAYPKFVKTDLSTIKKGLSKQILSFLILITIFFVLTFIFIPIIFKYLLPAYIEYAYYARIYSLSLFSVLVILPYTILQAKSMSKYLYQYEIFNNTMQIIFIIIGMYYFGLVGAIVARTVGSIFNTATIYMFIRRI